MKVEVKCQGAGLLDIDKLTPFQGDLKSLQKEDFEKLKAQLLELGFCEPITIWDQGLNLLGEEQFLIANGHQRLRTLSVMRREGIEIPKIPVSFVWPKNKDEFAKIVLSLCSQYGKVEKEGMYEYCAQHAIPVEFIETRLRLPELEVPKYKAEFHEDLPKSKRKFSCPQCGFEPA